MPAALDLAAVKDAQRRMWATGDYAAIATKLVPAAETLVEATDPAAGSRVLDVAAGSGNAGLAAARAGCRVTALDYVEPLLERAAARAAAEGVELETVQGDAEALPFADGSFDAVLSVFGVMFAPDQERAAAELARVCRPGGAIALACWTPEGAVGAFFRLVASYAPPPEGAPAPVRWGTEEGLRDLLGDAVAELRLARREVVLRAPSPEAWTTTYLTCFGPTMTAAASLDGERRAAFAADLTAFARRNSRRDDAVAIPAEYLEVVATRAEPATGAA